ncbi:uncharacterized protein LOC107883728 [Acyrthosiphon pisum]|uniref:THAP-type domain-containing protein n=1 Tax=Acyrthosiphon pisum TaxID=7029 RepID=A0A8R2JLL2_ACYPI|nr:uncharacterized protein LOC107883728 [Acyrthosiphon pisum]
MATDKLKKSVYKYCFVSLCKNTSVSTPDKIFLNVPESKKLRRNWLKAARCDKKDVSDKSHLSCCEDHFDIENDLENYIQYKLMGLKRLVLKKGIIPHTFDCHSDRKRSST